MLLKKLFFSVPILHAQVQEVAKQVEEPSTCQDRLNNCDFLISLCAKNVANVQYYCQETCQTCDQNISLTTTVSPLYTQPNTVAGAQDNEDTSLGINIGPKRPVPAGTCYDQMGSKCAFYKPLCLQPDAKKRQYFVMQCKQTCGYCQHNNLPNEKLIPTLAPIEIIKQAQATQNSKNDTEIQAIVDPNCEDKYPACKSTTNLMCQESVSVKINCPKKCGICKLPNWMENENSEPESVVVQCQDVSKIYCNSIKHLCQDENYVPSIHLMCPITCGQGCKQKQAMLDNITKVSSVKPIVLTTQKPTLPPVESNCVDKPTCKLLTEKIYCQREIARKNCPVLCNACPVDISTTVSTTTTTEAEVKMSTQTQPQSPKPTELVTTKAPLATEESVNSRTESVIESTCQDRVKNCPVSICTMPGPKKQEYARKNCQKTCGLCVEKSSSCIDKANEFGKTCPAEFCGMPGPRKRDHVLRYCRKSCGICQVMENIVTQTETISTQNKPEVIVSTTVKPQSNCKDRFKACKFNQNKCENPKNKIYMKKNCPVTCGYCPEKDDTSVTVDKLEVPKKIPVCKDNRPKYCTQFGPEKCNAGKYKNWMAKNCRVTCSLC